MTTMYTPTGKTSSIDDLPIYTSGTLGTGKNVIIVSMIYTGQIVVEQKKFVTNGLV
jgi:hypothetical protein